MEKVKPLRVVRDFRCSPYKKTVGIYTFIFSSRFNLERFKAALHKDREHFKARCNKLYGMAVAHNIVSTFALYQKIERRGFLVYMTYGVTEMPIYSPDAVQIVADIMIKPGA